MVNDRLPEMRFVLAQNETMRLSHGIWPHPERDHSTFMKICGAFDFKLEPGFQSSLLLWWLKSGLKESRGEQGLGSCDSCCEWRSGSASCWCFCPARARSRR